MSDETQIEERSDCCGMCQEPILPGQDVVQVGENWIRRWHLKEEF